MIHDFRRSLVLQLAWPLAATLLASFAVATGVSIVVGRRAIMGQMTDSLRSEGLVVLSEVQHFLDQRLVEVELWSADSALDDVLIDDRDLRVQNHLLRLQRAFPSHYLELNVLERSGSVLASTQRGRIGLPLDLTPFDLQPIDRSAARASRVVVLPNGDAALVFVHPIRSRLRSDAIGTFVAFVAWKPIEEIMGRHREGSRVDEFAVLLDPSGSLLAGRALLAGPAPAEIAAAIRRPATVMHASVGDRGRFLLMAVEAGPAESRLGRPFHVVAFREDGASSSVMRIFVSSVVVAALVGLVLAAGTSFVLAKRASRRLHLLMDTTRRIAKGDLSHRVQGLGDDELGELASCLNAMSDELATARSGLERLVESRTMALRERTDALEESEARKSAIVASSLDGIVTFGADGRVQEFNAAAERIFGVPHQDAMRLFITDLIVPPSFVANEDAFIKYLKTEDELMIDRRHETFGRRPAGGQFRLELTITRIRTGGAPLFTAFVRDITEQARVEHQLREAKVNAEQTVRAKAEFLTNMSHEIRTPMKGVVGVTDLLSKTDLNPVQCEYVDIIRGAAGALVSVIDDILDFSRIEAGKLQLEHAPFDPRVEVEHLIDLLAPQAHAKGLELSAVLPPGLPSCVFGDPARVRQVLFNLLNNAVRFTSSGEVIIRAIPRSDAIEFEVADTGIGIARDALDRVFKPFAQVDASAPKWGRGTGLGLAISKHLVEAMGGRISVRSQEGHGSQFFVSLPVETSVGPADHRLPEAVGKSALVASAHPTIRLVVRRHLEAFGFDVDDVADASELWPSIHHSRASAYALAVVDVELLEPSLDRDVLRGAPPLIVLVPVAGEAHDSTRLMRSCDQLLSKPVKRGPVHATVVAALAADARSREPRSMSV
jgi:PAS domain S-box-containing protein